MAHQLAHEDNQPDEVRLIDQETPGQRAVRATIAAAAAAAIVMSGGTAAAVAAGVGGVALGALNNPVVTALGSAIDGLFAPAIEPEHQQHQQAAIAAPEALLAIMDAPDTAIASQQ